MDQERGSGTTRRAVLAGAGAVGAAVALGGCAAYGEVPGGAPSPPPAPPAAGDNGSPQDGAAAALAAVADIPVGGGKVIDAQKIVITQPTRGTFKCFSAICTHQGCAVNEIAGGTINCPCHGSKFKIEDGSVAAGPAPTPLPPVNIKVAGTNITLA